MKTRTAHAAHEHHNNNNKIEHFRRTPKRNYNKWESEACAPHNDSATTALLYKYKSEAN